MSGKIKVFVLDEVYKALVRWSIVAVALLAAYVATPIGERFVAIWNSPIILDRILLEISSSKDIVDWSVATQFSGPCYAGEVCTLIARVKRLPDTVECRVIPEATTFSVMSFADFVPRIARQMNAQGRNIRGEYQTVEIEIEMPRTIPTGIGELRVTTSYRDCHWQSGGEPPVSQVSPAIKFDVRER